MAAISSFGASRFILQQNLKAESRVQDLRIQASTGKAAQSYDGISDNVRRLEGLESDFAANKAFQRNIDRTEVRLQEMESSVDTMSDVASRFRTQLISAANGGGNLESVDLDKIAGTFLDESQGVVNTELGGRFLFSGSATATKPVDNFDALNFDQVKQGQYYQGNKDSLTARLSTTTTLDYGVTAEPNTDNGFHKLFTALKRVIESPNSPDAVEKAIRDLSGGQADSVLRLSNLTDPSAALETPAGGGLGGFPHTLDIDDRSGNTLGTINVNTGDSLHDVAQQITNTVNDVSARVANQKGQIQLEVFSDSDGRELQLGGTLPGVGSATTALDRRVDGAIDELADTRSEIGSSRGLLDTTKTQVDQRQTTIENGISDVEDVDLTRAMTLLAQNQTTLQSSFAVTARLQQVSLLNFLR